jgi:hypothetical protein
MNEQLQLFDNRNDDIERQIQAILARRRHCCCSGVDGEDVALIRAALAAQNAVPPVGC